MTELPGRLSHTIVVPELPAIVQRVHRAIESTDAGVADVGDMIGADPALAGKVMLVANSVIYGLAQSCRTPRQACTMLGLASIRNIVIQATMLQRYEHLSAHGYDVSALSRDAPVVGFGASMFARCVRVPGAPPPDDAYVAGLLHDIGELILLDQVGEFYATIQSAAACGIESLAAYERRELGVTHAEIGARAVDAWGFGTQVRDAVLHHHARVSTSTSSLTACVVAADLVVEQLNHNRFTAAVDLGSQTLGPFQVARAQVSDVVEALYSRLHGSRTPTGRIRAPLPSASDPSLARSPATVRRR
jgi:HD-like signal output (HDOD) protein